MMIKTKVVFQERKIAALTSDQNLILSCLKKCALVKLIDNQNLHLLVSGDFLIIYIKGTQNKAICSSQISKMLNPILKDIRHQFIQSNSNQVLAIQFNSQTSLYQFIQRIKQKSYQLVWQIKQKDSYQCIKKSIKFLLKQRKNKNYQQPQNYLVHQTNHSVSYSTSPLNEAVGYQQIYYNNYSYYSPGNGMRQNNFYGYFPQSFQYYAQYKPFIRKAIDSDSEQDNFQKLNQSQASKNSKQLDDQRKKIFQNNFQNGKNTMKNLQKQI